MSPRNLRHSMPRELTQQLADNEILLSFDNDDGGEAFYEWWADEGFGAFNAYVYRNEEDQ